MGDSEAVSNRKCPCPKFALSWLRKSLRSSHSQLSSQVGGQSTACLKKTSWVSGMDIIDTACMAVVFTLLIMMFSQAMRIIITRFKRRTTEGHALAPTVGGSSELQTQREKQPCGNRHKRI